MYVRRRYGFWMTVNWSKKPLIIGFIYALFVSIVHWWIKYRYAVDISINWQPISVIGIAVAFYLGFKNNASYDRTWEARKIWGGIVNTSRSFTVSIISFIQGTSSHAIRQELVYRHIAWLTALRYQLRLTREWEHTDNRVNGIYSPKVCEQYYDNIEKELRQLITEEEFEYYKRKSNMATQILNKQSIRLQEFYESGHFDSYKHVALQSFITELYNEQGRCERIKNFPFPRQYASAGIWIAVVFSALLPFGLLNVISTQGAFPWGVAPLSALTIWVFFLTEMIGDFSENPFEGTYNDVPITSIAVAIEIDLREMLDEENIRKPMASENGFLM